MPTDLQLVRAEQYASAVFVISSFQSLASAYAAEQALIEKEKGNKTEETEATVASAKMALDSTVVTLLCYIIFTLVAIIRKRKVQESNEAGTTSVPIAPNIAIVLGFIVTTIGTIMRIPAIQEKLNEAETVVL